MHAAHEHRDEHDEPIELVHRDVSPQNILVGADGVTRLTDFGVARASSRLSATRVGQLKGKIAYMSPEQASGEGEVDRRADVFSAGVVLWEVLAGRRLFKAENEAATLSRVISEPIPELGELVPELPKSIVAACARALERDPEARFSTCAEFAEALETAAAEADALIAAKQVATYVADVMGGAISQKREAVRAWLTRSEPSQPAHLGPPSSRSGPPTLPAASASQSSASISTSAPSLSSTAVSAGLVPPPAEKQSRSKRGLWLALLVLVGAAGATGWWVTQGTDAEPVDGRASAPALEGTKRKAPTTTDERALVTPAKVVEKVADDPALAEAPRDDASADSEAPEDIDAADEPAAADKGAEAAPEPVPVKAEPKKRRAPAPRTSKKRRASKPAITRPKAPPPTKKVPDVPAKPASPSKSGKPSALDLSNPYR